MKIKIEELINKIELDNNKIFLLLLGVLIIFYLDYSFIMGIQRANIKALKPKVIKLKKDIDTLKNDLADINNLKTKKDQAAIVKQVISEQEFPSLLEKISGISNKYNVGIIQAKSFKEEKPKSAKTKPLQTAHLTPFFIDLDLSAGYHNLGCFIGDLENLEEFIIVQDIKIKRQEKDYLKESAQVLLKTYVRE